MKMMVKPEKNEIMLTLMDLDDYELFRHTFRFCERIDSYISSLNLDRVEVEKMKSDCYEVGCLFSNRGHSHNDGGSFVRAKIQNLRVDFSHLVQSCKNSVHYTVAIGKDLGFDAERLPHDFRWDTPELRIEYNVTGHPVLKWNKGIFEGVEIWKEKGTIKGYEKLDRGYNQQYTDVSPLPCNDNGEVWRYCIIYLNNEEMTGNWSDVVEVIVYGKV